MIPTSDHAPLSTGEPCPCYTCWASKRIAHLEQQLEVANAAHRGAEAEVAKWKRIYENTIVQKEGMQLYDEIRKLQEQVHHLEQVVIKGVWPK